MEYVNSNRHPFYNLIHVGTIYPDTNCVAVVVTLQIDERIILVTNRSNNMLLFGSWSNRNNNSFPSVVGINSIINHSQYPKTALAKHSVGFTRYNIPLDVMITGAK